MATLTGENSWKQVPLIVHCTPKSIIHKKNPETGERGDDQPIEGRFLEIQVDQSLKNPDKIRSGEAQADSNPFLNSEKQRWTDKTTGEDREITSHRKWYSEAQYQKMLAAGKSVAIDEPNGIGQGELISLKADLGRSVQTKDVIVMTTHAMSPGSNPQFGKNTLQKQREVTQAARDYRDAQRAAEREAVSDGKEVAVEEPVVTAEVEADQPEM